MERYFQSHICLHNVRRDTLFFCVTELITSLSLWLFQYKKKFKFDRDCTVNIVVNCMKLQDCILLRKIPPFVILRSVLLP